MPETLTHFIGGEAISASAHQGTSINPSNLDEVVAHYPKGSANEVDQAVQAAKAALEIRNLKHH